MVYALSPVVEHHAGEVFCVEHSLEMNLYYTLHLYNTKVLLLHGDEIVKHVKSKYRKWLTILVPMKGHLISRIQGRGSGTKLENKDQR